MSTIGKKELEELLKEKLSKNITQKSLQPINKLINRYKSDKSKKKLITHGLQVVKGSGFKPAKKTKLNKVLKRALHEIKDEDEDILVSKKKRKLNKGSAFPKREHPLIRDVADKYGQFLDPTTDVVTKPGVFPRVQLTEKKKLDKSIDKQYKPILEMKDPDVKDLVKPVSNIDKDFGSEIIGIRAVAQGAQTTASQALTVANQAKADTRNFRTELNNFDADKKKGWLNQLSEGILKLKNDLSSLTNPS